MIYKIREYTRQREFESKYKIRKIPKIDWEELCVDLNSGSAKNKNQEVYHYVDTDHTTLVLLEKDQKKKIYYEI